MTRWCGGWTSRFENFISDLRNAQKQQKNCDESSYTIQNIKCDSKHIFYVTMYFSFKAVLSNFLFIKSYIIK